MQNVHPAMFYQKLEDGRIECGLCPHQCKLQENQTGICKVRGVVNGQLCLMQYGMVAGSGQVDPIEKKPLYHFYPGSKVLSFGGVGCNLHCDHCQNSSLSQDYDARTMFPLNADTIIHTAEKNGCRGVAWTYNEPTIYFETYYDWSKIIKQHNLYVVWVSNSYISELALTKLAEVVDAVNFDVKSFSDEFYRRYTGARLEPVLSACIQAKKLGIHIELTYLVIPTLNDSMDEIQAYLTWVMSNLGKDVPLHFSRFFPHHRMMNLPPTSTATIRDIVTKAQQYGFPYVYAGNLYPNPYEDTYCPSCHHKIIQREGYLIEQISLNHGHCNFCNATIPIIQD